MTTIGKDSAVATVMVRFSVQPADVERLLEMSRRLLGRQALQRHQRLSPELPQVAKGLQRRL